MTLRIALFTSIVFISGSFLNGLCAQSDQWYVLKSVSPLSEADSKQVISNVMASGNLTTMWFNGSKSNTFGARNSSQVVWADIIQAMNLLGIYLADITRGRNHHIGEDATTSIYYQEALFCSIHTDECPEDYYAKLNQDEWNALPEEAQLYFETTGKYLIAE